MASWLRRAQTSGIRCFSTSQAPVDVKALAARSFVVGTAAGSAGSLVGLGGGFLSVPCMTSSFVGLSQHAAHATSLVGVLTTGSAGAAPFALAGHVDWGAAAAIAGGGVAAVRLGAQVAERTPAHKLKLALGCFLLCVAPMVLLKPQLMELMDRPPRKGDTSRRADGDKDDSPSPDAGDKQVPFVRLALLGGVVGLLGGIFGVGGGSIAVPALSLGCPEMTHHDALGTSLAAMVPTAIVGVARHASAGTINWPVAVGLGAGSLVSSFAGAELIARQMDETSLRMVFAAMMTVLGGKTVQSALATWRCLPR